mmetsp:Transcript_74442/g.140390  ORF Transcript_74442/g.140390 Transcript_74442/m.140390 type:complete len:354 (-) Transcript_74442:21-1082(-)
MSSSLVLSAFVHSSTCSSPTSRAVWLPTSISSVFSSALLSLTVHSASSSSSLVSSTFLLSTADSSPTSSAAWVPTSMFSLFFSSLLSTSHSASSSAASLFTISSSLVSSGIVHSTACPSAVSDAAWLPTSHSPVFSSALLSTARSASCSSSSNFAACTSFCSVSNSASRGSCSDSSTRSLSDSRGAGSVAGSVAGSAAHAGAAVLASARAFASSASIPSTFLCMCCTSNSLHLPGSGFQPTASCPSLLPGNSEERKSVVRSLKSSSAALRLFASSSSSRFGSSSALPCVSCSRCILSCARMPPASPVPLDRSRFLFFSASGDSGDFCACCNSCSWRCAATLFAWASKLDGKLS